MSTPSRGLIHVREWGAGTSATLLIHGFGDGAYIWDFCAPYFAHTHRLLAVDLRGHGQSSWDPRSNYSTHAYVADILRVVDRLRLSRLAIIGHSLGGYIGVQIAARRRELLTQLIVVDYGLTLNSAATLLTRELMRSQFRLYRSIDEYLDVLRDSRPMAVEETLRNIAKGAAANGAGLRAEI